MGSKTKVTVRIGSMVRFSAVFQLSFGSRVKGYILDWDLELQFTLEVTVGIYGYVLHLRLESMIREG